jgi:hypothetical protein
MIIDKNYDYNLFAYLKCTHIYISYIQRSIELESQYKVTSSELTVVRSKMNEFASKNSQLMIELESAYTKQDENSLSQSPEDLEGGGFQPNAFDDNFKDGKASFSSASLKIYVSQLKGQKLGIAIYVVVLHLVILRSVLFDTCL